MDKLTDEQKDLVSNNIRFVHHIAKRYVGTSGVPKDEIISAGYFGLVKAAKTFNPDRGSKFSTYAGICITNSMLDLFNDYKSRRRRGYKHMDAPVYDDDARLGIVHLTVMDLCDDGVRIEDDVITRSEIEERRFIIGLYLLNKSARYAQIIRLRLQSKTHEQIAREIGIGKSYVSRILTRIERELAALKNKIDKTNGEYIKRYSPTEIERAKIALNEVNCWIIQIERNSLEVPKNKSVHAFRPSVNFLHKELSFNSDLLDLLDPDSEQLDVMLTKTSDTEGVLIFKFRHSDASYFLRHESESKACIESSKLTSWLLEHGIVPKRYDTCYYDETERSLYVKVDCAANEKHNKTGDNAQ